MHYPLLIFIEKITLHKLLYLKNHFKNLQGQDTLIYKIKVFSLLS